MPGKIIPGQNLSAEHGCGQHLLTGRLSENSARSEGCEKLRIKISASEENGGVI